MKPDSALGDAHLHVAPWKQAVGYAAAIVFPGFFIVVSFQTHALHSTPLALSMASVALITIFSGAGPGGVAAAWTALFLNHKLADPGHFFATGPRELGQTAAALAVGLLILFFFQRQHVIGSASRSRGCRDRPAP